MVMTVDQARDMLDQLPDDATIRSGEADRLADLLMAQTLVQVDDAVAEHGDNVLSVILAGDDVLTQARHAAFLNAVAVSAGLFLDTVCTPEEADFDSNLALQILVASCNNLNDVASDDLSEEEE